MSETPTKQGKRYGLRTNNSQVKKANQWQGTPQQEKWLLYYLDPKSPTFGNPYASAMEAGYSEKYSRMIASPSVGNLWVKEARNIISLKPEHIIQKLQEFAIDNNEKSEVQLRALELLAKTQGMFIDRKVVAHGTFEEALRNLK